MKHLGALKLCTATKASIKAYGIIPVIVEMGTIKVCKWFGIINNLAVDILLTASYIDQCIEGIFHTDTKVVPIHSALIPFFARDICLYTILSILSHKASSLTAYEFERVQVPKRLIIQAKTEYSVIVVPSRDELMNIERIETYNATNRVVRVMEPTKFVKMYNFQFW